MDKLTSSQLFRQTSNPFKKPEFSVRRRFTDFVFLRQTLHREYPACAVPPLPEKNNMNYVRGGGFSTEFTQRRAWSLHRFIKRLTLHPVLRRATILILFLETTDWNAHMKSRPGRSNTASEAGGGPGAPSGSSIIWQTRCSTLSLRFTSQTNAS